MTYKTYFPILKQLNINTCNKFQEKKQVRIEARTQDFACFRRAFKPLNQWGRYGLNIAFTDMKTFYKQLTVNYLLNPEKWTRPKVNTERSEMNNTFENLTLFVWKSQRRRPAHTSAKSD